RLAPHRDAPRIARGCKRVSGTCILEQPALGRRAGRAAIAAIVDRDEPGARRRDALEAIGARRKRAAIAMEIEHDWLVALRREMPGDDLLAVTCFEYDLLGLRKAGGRGRGALRVGKIQELALREEHHCRESEIADGRDDECPFKKSHPNSLNAQTNIRD